MNTLLTKSSSYPFSGIPASYKKPPLVMRNFSGGPNVPIGYIPSVRGELFEVEQPVITTPPLPVYAYDILFATHDNPLGTQQPQHSLSEEQKLYLNLLMMAPESTFIDRVSSKDVLGRNDVTKTLPSRDSPMNVIIDPFVPIDNKIVINQPSNEARVSAPPPPPAPSYKIDVTAPATMRDLEGGDFVDELKMKLSGGGIRLKPAGERKLPEKKPRKTGTKIINPKTGREVLADGPIGRKILKELPEAPVGGFDIIPKESKEKERKPSIEEIAENRFAERG